MASLLLCLLLLPAPLALPDAGAVPAPLIRAVDLDAGTLLAEPSLLAADRLALVVESSREAFYKLSEGGDVLAAGKLLPGANSLRFSRPGLAAGSQSLLLRLDLLEHGAASQKLLRIQVTVEGGAGMEAAEKAGLTGSFRLEMYHAGKRIGFRRKSMTELLNLKTGPVAPVTDPALSGSAIRSQPASQSISVLGLGMALAKYLAGKKAAKRAKARQVESQKRRLAMSIIRGQREFPIVIELRVE
jgi:hypothetical protein